MWRAFVVDRRRARVVNCKQEADMRITGTEAKVLSTERFPKGYWARIPKGHIAHRVVPVAWVVGWSTLCRYWLLHEKAYAASRRLRRCARCVSLKRSGAEQRQIAALAIDPND